MKHTKETLLEYRQLKSENRNPDNKPVVMYMNPPQFFSYTGEYDQARIYCLDHPRLGQGTVTTSVVLTKYDDDTFETLNTLYVRFPEEDRADCA